MSNASDFPSYDHKQCQWHCKYENHWSLLSTHSLFITHYSEYESSPGHAASGNFETRISEMQFPAIWVSIFRYSFVNLVGFANLTALARK